LSAQGDMLASISRFEDAQRTFRDAVAAYDEELNRVPDNVGVHLMKALALVNQGRLLRILDSEKRDVRARCEAAQSHAEHVVTLEPQYEQAMLLLAEIRELLNSLDDSS
jgi:hypothetical protein